MRLHWIIALSAALVIACSPEHSGEQVVDAGDGLLFYRLSVERLPDMNVPRGGHQTMALGDEFVVFGGHTDGFRPTRTAEYYADGAWHTLDMLYTHDEGAAAQLPDGRVMLMGGCPEEFGIGQSWGVESYDPLTHEFAPICILDRKRARSSALPLPDGRVIVSGNWYADDAVGVYRQGVGFSELKPVSAHRVLPVMLPFSDGQVLIFGSEDNRGGRLPAEVDRLEGDPFHEALLEEWELLHAHVPAQAMQIASDTYLLAAIRSGDGTCAVMKVEGEKFSILPTDYPLPLAGIEGSPISWSGDLQVDRPHRTAYVQGYDACGRIYMAGINYDASLEGDVSNVKMYYADPPVELFPDGAACLLSDGRFLLAGGLGYSTQDDVLLSTNFSLYKSVYILSTEEPSMQRRPWLWAGIGLLSLLVAVCLVLLRRRSNAQDGTTLEEAKEDEAAKPGNDLMSRIDALMTGREMFRQGDLKLSDLASTLGTNVTYISACINGQKGMSFNEYVTQYRVRYAQELMIRHPKMKIQQVGEDAGFTNDRSFFRSFKQVTGVTPGEWRSSRLK